MISKSCHQRLLIPMRYALPVLGMAIVLLLCRPSLATEPDITETLGMGRDSPSLFGFNPTIWRRWDKVLELQKGIELMGAKSTDIAPPSSLEPPEPPAPSTPNIEDAIPPQTPPKKLPEPEGAFNLPPKSGNWPTQKPGVGFAVGQNLRVHYPRTNITAHNISSIPKPIGGGMSFTPSDGSTYGQSRPGGWSAVPKPITGSAPTIWTSQFDGAVMRASLESE